MPSFHLPLSGDVTQAINPWTAMFRAMGSQFGLININLGRSSAPEVEQDILTEVGSYGRQIGRISDVLEVLIDQVEFKKNLSEKDRETLEVFKAMQLEIAEIKAWHRTAGSKADKTSAK
ncbi:hypothetical protein E1180_06960 [Roseibium denhamense]|uniref:Uncharacterized protein n=1 Tax=Roseibium denhamense TaxID=76305 RepID=A0ABY1PCI9_9HYPH|nr:hypothetical protein [Roseibium denhamense]MTI05253.1 hypothetical protein [Roseibium denhamense]SMP30624.1 hypothetical protein SAMN06265374_3308 [Roseibium denhamense]